MIVFVKWLSGPNALVQERCHHKVTKIELVEGWQDMIKIYHPDASDNISSNYLLSWYPNLEVR